MSRKAEVSNTIGLRVAVVAKQVPRTESLELDGDTRLRRSGLALELNPHCRRAVAQGVALAKATGGSCIAYTLGPPDAEDVIREAVAWGADSGVHLCDPAFAGSDTLATALALAAALRSDGPWDVVLCGRSSADAETGHIGPQLAELLDLPFIGAAATLRISDGEAWARCELGEGWRDTRVALPAVISCAERLISPCKATPRARADVAAERVRRVTAAGLGPGPWGEAASATRVGSTRPVAVDRLRLRFTGAVEDQVSRAVAMLAERGVLSGIGDGPSRVLPMVPSSCGQMADRPRRGPVAVVVEPGREHLTRQLIGAAAQLAHQANRSVVATGTELPEAAELSSWGADQAAVITGTAVEEDVAEALAAWCVTIAPSVVLGPSTSWGREVMARLAARCRSGLAGDAIELDVADGRLVCWKPAFSGRLLASVTFTSDVQLATIRPGVLATLLPRSPSAGMPVELVKGRSRDRVVGTERVDDIGARSLQDARVVVCVGQGVPPDEYPMLDNLLGILHAELGATRKVTDRGWLPRSRQVGITGWSLAPVLYMGLGTSGTFNHLAGVAQAGTIVLVNHDPAAPGFASADIGLVADWREAVRTLVAALAGDRFRSPPT